MTVADQLAQALADLMGAEGGEPGDSPEQRDAWAAAEDALIVWRRENQHGQIDPDERGGATGNAHPSTSRRAAANVRRGSQQSALLAIVAGHGYHGVTCFEATPVMRAMLGRDDLARNQVAARMGELESKGLAHRRQTPAGGGMVERATEGGATACVWFITAAGVAERERLAHA